MHKSYAMWQKEEYQENRVEIKGLKDHGRNCLGTEPPMELQSLNPGGARTTSRGTGLELLQSISPGADIPDSFQVLFTL